VNLEFFLIPWTTKETSIEKLLKFEFSRIILPKILSSSEICPKIKSQLAMTYLDKYYQTLGLSPDSTPKQVKQRYFALVKQYHPDLHANGWEKAQAEAKVKEIIEAYKQIEQSRVFSPYFAHNKSKKTYNPTSSKTKTNPKTCYQRGVQLANNNELEAAIAHFTQAIKLDSNYLKAYQYRAFLLEKLGYTHRANQDFQHIARLQNKSTATATSTTQFQTEWEKIEIIPPKKIWLAIVFSLAGGVGGYLYTTRYRAMAIAASILLCVTAADHNHRNSVTRFMGLFILTAIVDNALAVKSGLQSSSLQDRQKYQIE
jgi:tetratricopeptide (TPR) repeat protein